MDSFSNVAHAGEVTLFDGHFRPRCLGSGFVCNSCLVVPNENTYVGQAL
jgi:hypothetical protein